MARDSAASGDAANAASISVAYSAGAFVGRRDRDTARRRDVAVLAAGSGSSRRHRASGPDSWKARTRPAHRSSRSGVGELLGP